MNTVFDAAAGFLCGILSGFGIGGGTLLVLYMTNVANIPQSSAQGINLIYFLPASAGALFSHIKNRLIHPLVIWSILAGLIFTAAGAYMATGLQGRLLKKVYGIFLLCVGIREFLNKSSKPDKSRQK